MNIKNVQYLSQPSKYSNFPNLPYSAKFWTYPQFVRPRTFGVISHKKKCSIDIDEDDDEEIERCGQSVPEITDDESFNHKDSEPTEVDYEEMVREFPDPFNYVIGFTCSSQINHIKQSTVVVSALEENKLNESINTDLENSPVQLYSKTFH